MLIVDLFYGLSWVLMVSVIWFYTDAFVYYSQLFKLFENTRLEFSTFLKSNPGFYFSDFLTHKAKKQKNLLIKFMLKLLSCPLCLNVWLSFIAAVLLNNVWLTAPIYILSIVSLFGIKRLI
jgi:hypothetical protein